MSGILVAASLSLGISGCDHSCTDKGCLDGLAISFDGTPDPGETLQIDLSQVTATPELVLAMTCSMSTNSAGGLALLCSSPRSHSEFGNMVVLHDYDLKPWW